MSVNLIFLTQKIYFESVWYKQIKIDFFALKSKFDVIMNKWIFMEILKYLKMKRSFIRRGEVGAYLIC